ncbi:ATP-grasp domain-containing protein [Halobacteriovorax sp. GB3]|uniref:D-alanine--D-alanine ligase family protein n=1 Tax=Halobacteriovorax sp. GB3 TaxID=2719615 RepID=UPI002361E701|nr:ATP-grasp domain-containing protein [Halobacteriovorax sp. GB3]MDD0851866.1 ATP-grasp domain-containing protein [Halobacteriovorax sp. GB3]
MKRILIITHPTLIPPKQYSENDLEFQEWATEYDIQMALSELGYEFEFFGVYDNLKEFMEKLEEFSPDVVFNLLEEFQGEVNRDFHIPVLLEMMNIPYTGCRPKGLMIGRDKSLTKKILAHHRIRTPSFTVVKKGSTLNVLPKNLNYPMIVKCLHEEASKGISQSSLVHSYEKLLARVDFIHQSIGDDALVEEFIEGRELFVGMMFQNSIKIFPAWELVFENSEQPEKEIYSNRAKFNEKYRERLGVRTKASKLTANQQSRLKQICKKAYKSLGLYGHARIDFRMNSRGDFYILEVNANPNLGRLDEFSLSARHAGISYEKLIDSLIKTSLKISE